MSTMNTKRSRIMKANPKLIGATIVLLALFGVKCVSAAIHGHKTIETSLAVPAYAFIPAELDPVFQKKLVQRTRAPYERSLPATSQTRFVTVWRTEQ
jgi:hypothetical protein